VFDTASVRGRPHADRRPTLTCGNDRLLAKLGLLSDAAPLFRDGERVPRAGVLLALPAIEHSGAVEIARDVYGAIGPRSMMGTVSHLSRTLR
jgi:hypothetical protein